MISAYLQGGLGNQMFQIATATAFAKRNKNKACFNFNNCHTPLQGNTSKKYKHTVFSEICDRDNIKISSVYNEPKFSYTEIPYTKDLLIKGYFQSYKYFEDYENDIQELFTLPTSIVRAGYDNITSVHVRRGDYVNLKHYHGICDLEYYQNAMKEIGNSHFLFFSDDMDWVKENFKGDNISYSNYDEEIIDLALMSICHNNIIANSSFSWWGAYLNKNKNKKVIAPKNWFGPKGPKDTQDLIPPSWIKM